MPTTLAIGIDPGKTGALAVIRAGEVVLLEDAPIIRVGKRQRVDLAQMAAWLRKGAIEFYQPGDEVRCVIEAQQAFPAQGRSSCFQLGENFGQWLGILAALFVPFEIVRPRTWKAALLHGLPTGDKGSSRIAASRLFPDADLGRRKDQGRADALLLAEYARRQLVGGVS